MRVHLLTTIAALAVAMTLIEPPARAQDWEYDLYVYGLGAGMDGTAGIGPVDVAVDVGFSDILDNLELGFMGSFRAKKGDWAVMVDAIFMGLGAANERVDIDIDEVILEVDVAYQFSEVFELLFGLRYVDIDTDIDFLGPLGVRASAGDNWVDPLVGLQIQAPMGDKWTFLGRLDVGGFGVGSDFSFQGALHLGYRLGESSTLTLGWRYLDVDYEDGDGLDRFKYDIASSGPQVGVVFHF
ncbi:MAG: hypothetical protein V3T72_18475 [Thermoanaerobaculia bacterium]